MEGWQIQDRCELEDGTNGREGEEAQTRTSRSQWKIMKEWKHAQIKDELPESNRTGNYNGKIPSPYEVIPHLKEDPRKNSTPRGGKESLNGNGCRCSM